MPWWIATAKEKWKWAKPTSSRYPVSCIERWYRVQCGSIPMRFTPLVTIFAFVVLVGSIGSAAEPESAAAAAAAAAAAREAQAEGWTLASDRDGILTYRRETPGSDAIGFRGDGEVQASVAKLMNIFGDSAREKECTDETVESWNISTPDSDTLIS